MHGLMLKGCKQFMARVLIGLIINPVFAQTIANTEDNTTATPTIVIHNSGVGNAAEWGLTQDEWVQYQKLLQGPNGHWYPQLSPAAVLGMNAKTPQAQQHFAELVAKEQHDKLARELAFDSAVHQALQRLYPAESVILPFDKSAFNPVKPMPLQNKVTLQAGDHLVLFVNTQQGLMLSILPQLLAVIHHTPDVVLDIFCQGVVDDAAIRTWAKRNTIPADLVAAGRITLNHDDGRLQKINHPSVPPYVLWVRNGEAKPVSTWNLR